MTQLTRFEANLLRILQAILERTSLEQVRPLMVTSLPRPSCLSRKAVRLIEDTLAKGMVGMLARQGWRRERHLRAGVVRAGRLWHRSSPGELTLHFSAQVLELLLWLTATAPEDKDVPDVDEQALSVADRLLVVWLYRLVRTTAFGQRLRQCTFVNDDALCRLMFAEDFGKKTGALDWSAWTSGLGSCILEALQSMLAARWVEMEQEKARVKDPRRLQEVGQSQERTLTSFLKAVDAAGRRDLARFVLVAARRLLDGTGELRPWVGAVDLKGLRLAERADVFRNAVTPLRQLGRLQQWERAARLVGYFDEGYAASQLWKADWESHQGDELCRRAEELLRQAEPL